MLLYEKPSVVKTRNIPVLEGSLKLEYLFFVDVLIQLHCGIENSNATIDFTAQYTPKNEDFEKKDNNKFKREKRGVMENIVSAYSQIVTKG